METKHINGMQSAGRFCLSEDDCIAQGIHFGNYERGVADAIKACQQISATALAEVADLKAYTDAMAVIDAHRPVPADDSPRCTRLQRDLDDLQKRHNHLIADMRAIARQDTWCGLRMHDIAQAAVVRIDNFQMGLTPSAGQSCNCWSPAVMAPATEREGRES